MECKRMSIKPTLENYILSLYGIRLEYGNLFCVKQSEVVHKSHVSYIALIWPFLTPSISEFFNVPSPRLMSTWTSGPE